jgi:hypothetical protein
MKIMMKNILFTFIFMVTTVSFGLAQEKKNMETGNPIEAKRAEMNKLGRLVGQWQGTGWIQQGKNRETFAGTENVQKKIDGLALLVEGNFKNKEGVVIHETLAVLSPNLKTKNYDFRAYLASGNGGEYEFKPIDTGWQWGFQFPNGVIRYDIKINNDVWLETGEISQDAGKTWNKFFEMELKRVK